MTQAMVEIDRVSKWFGARQVLADVSLSVPAGSVYCILGPSGSGKSTLLRCVNHLERPDAGRILVDGDIVGYRQVGSKLHELSPRQVCRQRARIGMVFQSFNLFPHMTALENVIEAPIKVLQLKPDEARSIAMDLLEQVGVAPRSQQYPRTLSGGEKQRVAIARALAMRPRVMLFDEPTSALDPELVGDVLEVMRRLAESGMTMIVVTHEMQFAREVADHVVVMDDGRVIEAGSAREVLERPSHARTRTFLSRVVQSESADDVPTA